MTSPQTYSQTILLDANRLSSEEYSASNLAQTDTAFFTNKVSNGITLDVGDQVSIQSAHIAQRGAGGDTIQFSGVVLGEKDITYTKTTNSSYIGYIKLPGQFYSPTGYVYETSENVTEKIKMKDNEATIVFEYYKTTNGENNITLPRNYGMDFNADSLHSRQPDPDGAGTTSASYWNASDNFAIGLNTYFNSASHTFNPDYDIFEASNCCGQDCIVKKLKQDNSKYTMFKMDRIVWDWDKVSNETAINYFQPNGSLCPPDPACCKYNRYREKFTISVDEGYNSPSSIATEITNQLIKSDQPYITRNASGSIIVNSTTYKAFNSANIFHYDNVKNQYFFKTTLVDGLPIGVGANASNTEFSTLYLNNYAYVGFKRPDFVEAGRKINAYHGNKVKVNIPINTSGTALVYTNFSYNDNTLSSLKRFFDSQRLYPELLNYVADGDSGNTNYHTFNTTSASLSASFREEARFLHLQVARNDLSDVAPIGSDMYNVSYSSNDEQPPRANASDLTTIPLFIYFNNNSSHLTAEQTIGDQDDNLAYGFARKWSDGGQAQIAFLTKNIGGIPQSYFTEQLGNIIGVGTKIGYDYHFNAYGNAALIMNNGYPRLQYYGHQAYINTNSIREIYLGANNILLNFNDIDSRFELSNLHSAEKVGNFYNAGDPNPPDDILAPPPSAQAGSDCYKINKQLRYDTWSPVMQPYPLITVSGSKVDSTQNSFISMNTNLLPSHVYDAQGGISLVDMGITEDKWEDSIWGLLGFEYGQFNASGNIDDIKNINNRFTNENSNSSGITTNADITSQNSLQFSMSAFGTNLFNPNVNDDLYYFNTPKKSPEFLILPTETVSIVQPPIVVTSDDLSTKIIANKLPRKILRGYFLINSDILDTANYFQLSNPLQTMAVVGKYNAASDFVNYDGGGPIFTVTRRKTITDIKTQILDPEGSLAQVGDNSGVIYRIDKTIKTDLNFAENLMAGMYGKPPQ